MPTEVGPNKRSRRAEVEAEAGAQTEPHARTSDSGGPDRVDAVNQVFVQFKYTYHNQFHKAFPDEDSLTIAKRYWFASLEGYPPAVIIAAAKNLQRSSEFLPSLAAMVRACEQGAALLGLPELRQAYIEACTAPSPKREFAWSHPAVYHAGRAAGWRLLAAEPESAALPVFEYYYTRYRRQVMQGQELEVEPPAALPAETAVTLTPEELSARVARLRADLKS